MFTQLSTEPHVRNEKKEQQQQQKQQQQQNMQGDWDTVHIKRKTLSLINLFLHYINTQYNEITEVVLVYWFLTLLTLKSI